MADLEQRLDLALNAFATKRVERARAFRRPDATLRKAIAYVKQAQATKKPVIVEAPEGTARLTWTSRGTFHLMHGQRGRWGDGAQTAEDIKHFLDYGVLPRESGPSWY